MLSNSYSHECSKSSGREGCHLPPGGAGGAGGHSQPVPLGRRRPCAISRLRLAAAGLGASAAVRERCGSAAGIDGSAAVRERCGNGSAAGMDGGAAGMGGPCGAGALRFRPRSRLEVCGRAGDGCFLKSQALSVPESSVGGLRLVWGIFCWFFFFFLVFVFFFFKSL